MRCRWCGRDRRLVGCVILIIIVIVIGCISSVLSGVASLSLWDGVGNGVVHDHVDLTFILTVAVAVGT